MLGIITYFNPVAGETIIFLAMLAVVAYFAQGTATRCPSCKRYFARTFAGDELVDKNQKFDTVLRRDKHFNTQGQQTGYTTRREQVRMTYERYLHHYTCKFCSFEWSTEFGKKYEG